MSGSPSITNVDAEISGDTTYNGSSTDTESRPDNFTIRIYKRIS